MQVAQRAAFHVLHHDEVGARLLAPVVDRDDVRVVEVRGGLGLAPESLDERRLACELGEERLQRDQAIERLVAREVHLGHATLRDLALDPISVRKDLADQRHRGETLSVLSRIDGLSDSDSRAGCIRLRPQQRTQHLRGDRRRNATTGRFGVGPGEPPCSTRTDDRVLRVVGRCEGDEPGVRRLVRCRSPRCRSCPAT